MLCCVPSAHVVIFCLYSWVAAIILPFFTKDKADKKAAIASGVTMVAITVAVVVAVVALTATATAVRV